MDTPGLAGDLYGLYGFDPWAMTSAGQVRVFHELVDRLGLVPESMSRVFDGARDPRTYGWGAVAQANVWTAHWVQMVLQALVSLSGGKSLPGIGQYPLAPDVATVAPDESSVVDVLTKFAPLARG
ncbi:hypothetical protein HMPREF3167_03410 [Trueperella sp. HMSC08B05]|nr:hypothetical protein HMPREF3167_03410 [Trueperella sp. HMSC08B05]PKZ89303.1 hypothetical protein CYK24_03140 [Trueperella bernardiae]